MTDYVLHYWPAPFRGQFVRAVLAHAGIGWTEAGTDETAESMGRAVGNQKVPHMAPPMLVDHSADYAIAHTPAICVYLARKHGLMPGDDLRDALAVKLLCDANDVLDEITCDGGREMWDADNWHEYEPRLRRWMAIFQETGTRHGLTDMGGTMLGTQAPGIADLTAYALWFPMTDKLRPLRKMLEQEAPTLAALVRRLSEIPALAALQAESDRMYGDTYCGGQIEKSLRKALD